MWFLTEEESRRWSEGRGYRFEASGEPIVGPEHCVQVSFEGFKWSQLGPWSQFISSWLQPFDECLLMVTLDLWSSEHRHLLYRLRESYHERRHFAEAPGHLFLPHEGADLATFVELGLLCGWDFHVLPAPTERAVVASHDGLMWCCTDDAEAAKAVRRWLDG